MKGTALVINEDRTVTILEDVEKTVFEVLSDQKKSPNPYYIDRDIEIYFNPIDTVVWHEDAIDWDYGY